MEKYGTHFLSIVILLRITLSSICLECVEAGCSLNYEDVKEAICPENCRCWTEIKSGLTVDCSGGNFQLVPSYIPKETTQLILRGNFIKILKQNDLLGCSLLATLDISNNKLEAIELNALWNLESLRCLRLNNNSLIVNEKKLIANLSSSLEELHVQDNIFFSDEVFTKLNNLKILSIDRKDTVSFGESFKTLTSLETLNIYGEIRELGNDSFAFLSEIPLKNLNVKSKDTLRTLQPLTFASLPNLQDLDMSYNKGVGFDSVSKAWYGLQFTKINTLRLTRIISANQVSNTINSSFYDNLSVCNITKLYLNRNNIVEIGKNLAKGFPNLEYFDLSFNRLSNVATLIYELALMPKLKYGDFSYSNKRYLKKRSAAINNFPNMLSKNVNNHSNADADLQQLSYKSSTCETPAWKPCTFDSTVQLVSLYGAEVDARKDVLKDVPLPDFGPWCFMLDRSMEVLNLSSSLNVDLKFFPQVVVLGKVKNMTRLTYRSNGIDSFPGPLFFAAGSLQKGLTLDIGDNGATCVSPDILKLSIERGTKVKSLILDKNELGSQLSADQKGKTFKIYEHLTELNLASNNIKTLPENIFHSLHRLELLNLSGNSLRNVSFNFLHFSSLKMMDISNNLITDIEKKILTGLKSLMDGSNMSINLNGNPLQCFCESLTFLEWINTNQENIVRLDTMSCLFNNTFTTFDKLSSHILPKLRFDCSTSTILIVSGSLLGAICLTVIVLVFLYRHRWDIRFYLLNIRKERKQYHLKADSSVNYLYDAFISYDKADVSWVRNELIYNLEMEKYHKMILNRTGGRTEYRKFRFCVHERDFPPGGNIQETIMQTMERSRKIILVLSKSYLKSNWCRFELEMSQRLSLDRGLNLSIPIIISDIGVEEMPNCLRWLIKRKTYIVWSEGEADIMDFWKRLHDVLKAAGTENWVCECGKTIYDQDYDEERERVNENGPEQERQPEHEEERQHVDLHEREQEEEDHEHGHNDDITLNSENVPLISSAVE